MTRTTNDGWGPCIDERAGIGNRANADAAISIHADGGPAGGRGFHVLMPALVPGYTDDIYAASHRLGVDVRDAFLATGMPTSTYYATQGLAERTDLGGLNLSNVPKVFIETGNMRNATDAALLKSADFRQRSRGSGRRAEPLPRGSAVAEFINSRARTRLSRSSRSGELAARCEHELEPMMLREIDVDGTGACVLRSPASTIVPSTWMSKCTWAPILRSPTRRPAVARSSRYRPARLYVTSIGGAFAQTVVFREAVQILRPGDGLEAPLCAGLAPAALRSPSFASHRPCATVRRTAGAKGAGARAIFGR